MRSKASEVLHDWISRHPEDWKLLRHKSYAKLRRILKKKVEQKFAGPCYICGKLRRKYIYHQIRGQTHVMGGLATYKYILDHPNEFIKTCYFCHPVVHAIAHNPKYNEVAGRIQK